MFLGTHTPRLDDKGRLFLPARFRDELAGGLVITRGEDRCLYVFPTAEFQRRGAELPTGPRIAPADRAYSRLFFASASDEVPDRQGRITVPPGLRAYAGLTRDCVVTGQNTFIEVWDAATWDAYLADGDALASATVPAAAGNRPADPARTPGHVEPPR